MNSHERHRAALAEDLEADARAEARTAEIARRREALGLSSESCGTEVEDAALEFVGSPVTWVDDDGEIVAGDCESVDLCGRYTTLIVRARYSAERTGEAVQVAVETVEVDETAVRAEADRMAALMLGQTLARLEVPAATIDRFVARDRMTAEEAAAFDAGSGVGFFEQALADALDVDVEEVRPDLRIVG